jgi:hypothetical protein
MRSPSQTRARLGSWARRALILGTIAVLLVALLRGGSRYFYCPAMQLVSATSCCRAAGPGGEEEARRADEAAAPAAVGAEDCCAARRLGTIAAAPLPDGAETLTAPWGPVVPAAAAAARPPGVAAAARFGHPVRAGPRPARERRARLMVFHC